MAWYKTGTVSVITGDTVVTATGTRFASNVRVGDGFTGPDGEWYEVVNIASETVLGIYPAYKGPSLADQTNYMIAPLQGYNKESADRLRAITDGFKDVTADVEAAKEAREGAEAARDAAKVSETNSKTSETNSKTSETNAAASAAAALASENAAKTSETNAKTSETNSKASETAADASKTQAGVSATNAANSADEAAQKATEASTSATNAKTSETNAKASETAAKSSETAAGVSETNAAGSATDASSDAAAADAARILAEKARDDAIAAAGTVTGSLMDQGPWDASTGAYPTKPVMSSFWKVTGNGSATDGGVTIEYGIGDTLMFSKPLDEFYKIDNTESVSSVNGKTGVVVVSKTDVGLGNADNTSDANKPVSGPQQTALNLKADKSQVASDLNLKADKSQLGTAAAMNVTTSSTNRDPNKLMKTGDFGIGADSIAVGAIDLNSDTLASGEYYVSAPTNAPNDIGWAGYGFYKKRVTGGTVYQELSSALDGRKFSRYRSDTGQPWSPWVKEFSSRDTGSSVTNGTVGQLMKVGDFGIGTVNGPVILETNINSIYTSGMYYVSGSGAGVLPTNTNGYLTVESAGPTYAKHTFTHYLDGRVWVRTANNGVWSGWAKINNPVKSTGAEVTDLNNTTNGIQMFNIDFQNIPPSIGYGVVQSMWRGPTECIQWACGVTSNNIAMRRLISGAWTSWQDMTPPGVGQVWFALGGARSLATNFVNGTGRSIHVNVIATAAAGSTGLLAYVEGIALYGSYSSSASGGPVSISFIVPPGNTYNVQPIGGTATLSAWSELR
ncbi:MAG: tail fiber protein [Caudoviricetes sp.]|nr:MAG: tail fiber protein [Caudoviricetes sp.]